MNISKQKKGIINSLGCYGRNVEITHLVSTMDSNLVTYYVHFTQGQEDNIKRTFDITVEKTHLIWLTSDYIGLPFDIIERIKKSLVGTNK